MRRLIVLTLLLLVSLLLLVGCQPITQVPAEDTPIPGATVTPTMRVTGTITGTPETEITGTITGTPETEITGTITGTPETEITGTITVTPETEITGTITGTPETEITGTVTVTPETEITGTVTVTPEIEITGTVTITPAAGGASTAGGDVLGALQAEGLSEFVAALQASGLAEALTGEGPFTVFAPTDEAFAAVPAATGEDAEAMALILPRHIVVDQVSTADLAALGTALTIQGDTLVLATAGDGTLTVEGASVIRPDIPAANGVIHVIDAVLLPPGQ